MKTQLLVPALADTSQVFLPHAAHHAVWVKLLDLHAEAVVILTRIQQACKNSPISNWNSLHQPLPVALKYNHGGYMMWLLKQVRSSAWTKTVSCVLQLISMRMCAYTIGNGSCDRTVGCMWFPWLKYTTAGAFSVKGLMCRASSRFLKKGFSVFEVVRMPGNSTANPQDL